MTQPSLTRPIVLVTGASRAIGIGAAIALALAQSGWDVATTFWRPYDATMPWGNKSSEAEAVVDRVRGLGSRAVAIEADLSDTAAPARIFDAVEEALGPVTALVMSHCQSVDSNITTTSVESFDLHFAINARATWLLIREFGLRYRGGYGAGRIIAITSDHTVENLPYGASKGAMDRIVLAAAHELKPLGVTAQCHQPRRNRHGLDVGGTDGVGAAQHTSRARRPAAGLRQPGQVPMRERWRVDQRPVVIQQRRRQVR